jgi:hypothetical protein
MVKWLVIGILEGSFVGLSIYYIHWLRHRSISRSTNSVNNDRHGDSDTLNRP